jgi:hypothetical protein
MSHFGLGSFSFSDLLKPLKKIDSPLKKLGLVHSDRIGWVYRKKPCLEGFQIFWIMFCDSQSNRKFNSKVPSIIHNQPNLWTKELHTQNDIPS